MDIRFPLQIDNKGRTATTDYDSHVRDMIEELLFTAPGERVNNPSFGCGLAQLVFEPNSNELSVTTQFLVQGALQQWLGDIIEVKDVEVKNEDSKLQIIVTYIILRTAESTVVKFPL